MYNSSTPLEGSPSSSRPLHGGPAFSSVKKTIVYIDGFNLYYGAIKGTQYKWLDLKQLSTKLLTASHSIVKIKYFIAKVGDRGNSTAHKRQRIYLKALQRYIPEIHICYGFFREVTFKARIVGAAPSVRKVHVKKSEEKGSDVNLAVHLVNDAWLGEYDSAMVISNDSDLAESLKLVRKHHNKEIILANPHKHPYSVKLIEHASSVRRIRQGILADSQLPTIIPGTNLRKPSRW